ncbi:MAG: GNAT family N-acetyltransferase [Candidatus Dormibacteraceae bacterium]
MIDWTPRVRPEHAVLAGRRLRLEPLSAEHAAGLWTALGPGGGDPRLWDYLPNGPFAEEAAFAGWVENNARSEDPLFFAAVEQGTDRATGVVSYLRIQPQVGVIEIGHLLFTPSLQRTPGATEAIYLLAEQALGRLGYRRLEWKCDALNAPSRRAALRYGFTEEGTFRQATVVKGRNRDTTWFSLLDGEWPGAGAALRTWLAAENFDAEGGQRRALGEIRASALPAS